MCACERVEENYLSENVEYAAAQYDLLIEKLGKNGKPWAPRTVDTKGNIVYAHNVWDWTSGFSREAFGICIILREMKMENIGEKVYGNSETTTIYNFSS